MKKLATIKRLALQIEYHIEIEESYPGFITKAAYEEVYDDKPNQKNSILERYVSIPSPEPALPWSYGSNVGSGSRLRYVFTMNTGMRSGFQNELAAFVCLNKYCI